MSAGYALIVDGEEVKRFPHERQCEIEAIERRLFLFGGGTWWFRPGVSIVAIEEPADDK